MGYRRKIPDTPIHRHSVSSQRFTKHNSHLQEMTPLAFYNRRLDVLRFARPREYASMRRNARQAAEALAAAQRAREPQRRIFYTVLAAALNKRAGIIAQRAGLANLIHG